MIPSLSRSLNAISVNPADPIPDCTLFKPGDELLNRQPNLQEGEIRTAVTERISPINAANLKYAHAKIESGKTIGKIVLEHFN
jgi:NADPH:quinone reductase-like Zn-dependent oxidoreductase